jgi:hypothetical protein
MEDGFLRLDTPMPGVLALQNQENHDKNYKYEESYCVP